MCDLPSPPADQGVGPGWPEYLLILGLILAVAVLAVLFLSDNIAHLIRSIPSPIMPTDSLSG